MIVVSGEGLSIDDIAAVARGAKVEITKGPIVLERVEMSRVRMAAAIQAGQQVYGVTTLYGAMADKRVPMDRMRELQKDCAVASQGRDRTSPVRRRCACRHALVCEYAPQG